VRDVLLLAPGARHESRHGGLPLRTAVTGVGTGRLPLRNGHGTSFGLGVSRREGRYVVTERPGR
jgi:hypothetical protein